MSKFIILSTLMFLGSLVNSQSDGSVVMQQVIETADSIYTHMENLQIDKLSSLLDDQYSTPNDRQQQTDKLERVLNAPMFQLNYTNHQNIKARKIGNEDKLHFYSVSALVKGEMDISLYGGDSSARSSVVKSLRGLLKGAYDSVNSDNSIIFIKERDSMLLYWNDENKEIKKVFNKQIVDSIVNSYLSTEESNTVNIESELNESYKNYDENLVGNWKKINTDGYNSLWKFTKSGIFIYKVTRDRHDDYIKRAKYMIENQVIKIQKAYISPREFKYRIKDDTLFQLDLHSKDEVLRIFTRTDEVIRLIPELESYTLFYPDSTIKERGSKKNGFYEGKIDFFYNNGQISKSCHYDGTGFAIGSSKTWFEDGRLESEETLNQDYKNVGRAWRIHNNGEVEFDHYYDRQGRLHGECNYYFEDGSTDRQEKYNHGSPIGNKLRWHENGKLWMKTTRIKIKNNWRPINDSTWHENGRLESIKKLNKFGLLDGETIYYYENGQIEYKDRHTEGMPVGPFIRYDINGAVIEKTCYKNAKPVPCDD